MIRVKYHDLLGLKYGHIYCTFEMEHSGVFAYTEDEMLPIRNISEGTIDISFFLHKGQCVYIEPYREDGIIDGYHVDLFYNDYSSIVEVEKEYTLFQLKSIGRIRLLSDPIFIKERTVLILWNDVLDQVEIMVSPEHTYYIQRIMKESGGYQKIINNTLLYFVSTDNEFRLTIAESSVRSSYPIQYEKLAQFIEGYLLKEEYDAKNSNKEKNC